MGQGLEQDGIENPEVPKSALMSNKWNKTCFLLLTRL